MTDADYRSALTSAIAEYEALGLERRRIDQRLAQLAQTIGTLNKLLGFESTVPLGLTDAIRMIMRGGVPLTPVEVRDRLQAIGFDVSKYVNDLAAIHTILKRLNDNGELRFIPRQPGQHQYALNRAVLPVVVSKDIVKAMLENAAEREAIEAVDEPEPASPRRRTVSHAASKRRRPQR